LKKSFTRENWNLKIWQKKNSKNHQKTDKTCFLMTKKYSKVRLHFLIMTCLTPFLLISIHVSHSFFSFPVSLLLWLYAVWLDTWCILRLDEKFSITKCGTIFLRQDTWLDEKKNILCLDEVHSASSSLDDDDFKSL
jgi:hypothetical protein